MAPVWHAVPFLLVSAQRQPRWRSLLLPPAYVPQVGTRFTSASGTSTRRRMEFPRLRRTRPAIRRGASSRSTRVPAALRSTGCSPRCTSRRTSGAATICARRCSTTTGSIRPNLRTTGPRRRARSWRCWMRSRTARRCLRRASILEGQSGARFSRDAWQELIFDIWFRQFDDGRNLDLSAFEHVAVGEQKDGKVNGHHFWYRCCGHDAQPDYALYSNGLARIHLKPSEPVGSTPETPDPQNGLVARLRHLP